MVFNQRGQSSTLKKESEKEVKRAVVSSAPAAPRRGVTSETGDGITQQPRLLARSGGQGERTRS